VTDQEHIRELYAVSAARLVAQLYAMTGDFAEAQDAVQEAFVRALARSAKVRELDNPEAWLRTVAWNVARSRHRRRQLLDRVVRSGRLGRPTDPPDMSPDHVALVAALQRLPVATRETVVLHHIADLPVADVARLLDCTVSAVKSRLKRGREALAEQLTDPAQAVEGRLAPPREALAEQLTEQLTDSTEAVRPGSPAPHLTAANDWGNDHV
jgi:RNA polymerase sigma-70 factor (ECF subfamily)